MAPTRVLYVNHTARVSGGERSLLDLLRGLAAEDVEPIVACPEGTLADRVRTEGIAVHPITGTDGSLKLHPVHTPRALAELARAGAAVSRLACRLDVDLVHANSVRAGLLVAARPMKTPVVAHIRDRLPPGPVSRASLGLIAARATLIAANSRYTAEGLPASAAPKLRVVQNPVDLRRFNPAAMDVAGARAALGVDDDLPILSVVAQVTPWKGQAEAIRTLAALGANGRDSRLLIVGETKFTSGATRYDNLAYRSELETLLDELGVRERVTFTGEREDVPLVLAATNVLLVPSWEEPFGRTVIEGMAMGLPVVATDVGGPADIIDDGVTGRLLAPRAPERWAEVLHGLLADDPARLEMGRRARERAQDFSLPAHVRAVLELYAEVS